MSSGSGVDPAQGLFSRINPNLGVGALLALSMYSAQDGLRSAEL